MFQIDHSGELVVIQKIVFLEFKVIGTAKALFCTAHKLRCVYRADFLVYTTEYICNNADTLVGFQFLNI